MMDAPTLVYLRLDRLSSDQLQGIEGATTCASDVDGDGVYLKQIAHEGDEP